MTLRCLLPAAAWSCLAALGAGCAPQAQPATQPVQDAGELGRLRRQNADLRRQLDDRNRQVTELLALGDRRLERLYLVQRIALGRATGGVDTDAMEGHDAVKVCVEPIDQHGSVIKAPGEVMVQLYDLAAPPAANLLAECRYDLDAAAKAWSSGLLAYHYAFTCPWNPQAPPKHNQLTVRVTFTDYLTGKLFEAQKVVQVDVAGTAPAAGAPASRPG